MKYKLALIDIDGTLCPNLGLPPVNYNPSKRIIEAFKKAGNKIKISFCTGRDKQSVLMIAKRLGLNSYHIIEGGAKIIDQDGNDLWTRYLSKEVAVKIITIYNAKTRSIIVDGIETFKAPKSSLDKISAIIFYRLMKNERQELLNKFKNFTDINMVLGRDRGILGQSVYITHKEGTKKHGIEKMLEIMGIKKEETIGIGDSYNDLPLLKACGFKIAMENSIPQLKEIADYIAPDCRHDGVAEVLEKFIIIKKSHGK